MFDKVLNTLLHFVRKLNTHQISSFSEERIRETKSFTSVCIGKGNSVRKCAYHDCNGKHNIAICMYFYLKISLVTLKMKTLKAMRKI